MAATRFGEMLDALIRERCGSILAFCEGLAAIGAKFDRGDVSRIINGSEPIRRPPADQLDAWAKVLRLSPKETKSFRFEALLTHTPDEIVEWIRARAARDQRHRRMIANLNERLDALDATRPAPARADAPGESGERP